MFTVYCTAVAAEVLLGPASIESLLSVGGEMTMDYRCSCGERGRWRRGKGEPERKAQAS
jgi:hypothetical protein